MTRHLRDTDIDARSFGLALAVTRCRSAIIAIENALELAAELAAVLPCHDARTVAADLERDLWTLRDLAQHLDREARTP